MALPFRHVIHQGPVLASLGGAVLATAARRLRGVPAAPQALPGPEVRETLPPRPPDLVRDYVRAVGGDPSAYRDTVPAHLFPQWGFPLAARTLGAIPYPIEKVINAGCRLEARRPLPAGEPLHVTARLEDIDDDGRRAILHQRIVTGTDSAPEAVVGHLYGLVPLARKDKEEGAKKEPVRVPAGAAEIAYFRLGPREGLAFAMLTGDFNPLHWVPAYARAFGYKSAILHGFATMARAIEGMNRSLFAGATDRISVFDGRFTRPLVLPARAGLYIDGNNVYVGAAPGGSAYLAANFETRRNP